MWGVFLVPSAEASLAQRFDIAEEAFGFITTEGINSGQSLYFCQFSDLYSVPETGSMNMYGGTFPDTSDPEGSGTYSGVGTQACGASFFENGGNFAAATSDDDYYVIITATSSPGGLPIARYFSYTRQGGQWFTGYSSSDIASSTIFAPFVFATSSVYIYCSQNVGATSTSFWSELSSSFGFALCSTAVNLFIPNSTSLYRFFSLASTTKEKIPFSYYYGIKNAFLAEVSTTTNDDFTSLSFVGIADFASSSPLSFVPSVVTVLSTTTVGVYLTSGIRTLLRTMATFALWIVFAEFLVSSTLAFLRGDDWSFFKGRT